MKFSTISNVKFSQVIAGTDIVATFTGPTAETDALNKSLEYVAKGINAIVYTYNHESIAINP